MKRFWTRAEKWLFAAPLLLGLAAVAANFGPDAARRALGYPRQIAATSANVLTSMSLSRDGKILVAGEYTVRPTKLRHNTIFVWDARTLRALPPLTRPATLRDDTTYCYRFRRMTALWRGAVSKSASRL